MTNPTYEVGFVPMRLIWRGIAGSGAVLKLEFPATDYTGVLWQLRMFRSGQALPVLSYDSVQNSLKVRLLVVPAAGLVAVLSTLTIVLDEVDTLACGDGASFLLEKDTGIADAKVTMFRGTTVFKGVMNG